MTQTQTPIRVQMKLGFRMILDAREENQRLASTSGEYEAESLGAVIRLLPMISTALDIGANIGFYSCALGSKFRERTEGGRVYAFEPVSTNARRFLENVALNEIQDFVRLTQSALGESTGEITMHIQPECEFGNAVGENMLADDDREHIARANWPRETVPLMRLDRWAQERGVERCEFIKIDVEGADLRVLRGGADLIHRSRPIIMGEFNPYWMQQGGETFEDVLRFFDPLDYAIWREVSGRFLPLTESLIAAPLEIPTYLLVPRERIEVVSRLLPNLEPLQD